MASLRQTRRSPSAATPPDRDTYHDPTTTPEAIKASNMSYPEDRKKSRREVRGRSVRKVKSHLAVSSQLDGDYGREKNGGSLSPRSDREVMMEGKSDGLESRERRKRQLRGPRSQSARPSGENESEVDAPDASPTPRAPDLTRKALTYSQPSTFLIPKTGNRVRSRSPSPMPPSPNIRRAHVDEDSLSDDLDDEPSNIKSRPKSRNTELARPTYRALPEDRSTQKHQRPTRLRAPTSRATSPLPPPTPTLNLPHDDSVSSPGLSGPSSSSAVRPPSSLSPPPLSARRETPKLPTDKISTRLPSRARSQSRVLQPTPSPISLPPTTMTIPRTLRDVTRRLEQDRGRFYQKDSSNSASEPHQDNFSGQPTFSLTPTPSRHRDRNVETGLSALLDTPNTMEQSLTERIRNVHPKPRHGLALTNENGSALGERLVEDIKPRSSQKSASTPDIPSRLPSAFSKEVPMPARPAIGLRSESLTKSKNLVLQRGNKGTTPENVPASRMPKTRQAEKAAAQTPLIPTNDQAERSAFRDRSLSGNPRPPSRGGQPSDIHDWHQDSTGQEHRPALRRQGSASLTIQTSPSPSSLPRPFSKSALVNRQPVARSAMPSLPSPRPSRIETSFSHKASGSESSVRSLPRLRKLVICNPDPDGRPSSPSSSNPDTPISTSNATSDDFTILAFSASQVSVGGRGNVGDYIVPDDVAAQVADEEERRRKALAGLVHGLHLESEGQAKQKLASGSTRSRSSHHSKFAARTRWGPDRGQEEDDEDDDAFFSRMSMHDDEESLLEEPEPEAGAGFREDEEDGFDEEVSDSQEEIGTEDEEQTEEQETNPPLPPTPKFVHPLKVGDDLESRITRIASLHRISTTPLPSTSRGSEQDRHMWARPEFKSERTPRLVTDEGYHDHRKAAYAQDVANMTDRQRSFGRDTRVGSEDTPEKQLPESRAEAAKSPESPHAASLAFHPGGDALSSFHSQSSNLVTDNELSSVGGGRLSDAGSGTEGTFSSGAEALFRQLQVEADAREAADGSKEAVVGPHLDREGKTLPYEMQSSSQSEDHHSDHQNTSKSTEPTSLRTWRSTLPLGAYDSLAERHGPSEMRRQEIIWELCETEQAFVKSLRLILRLFVQPLRHENRTWIPGVPRDVTRLFDWFDDIMHLHSQISSALHAARSAQYPVVMQIAETLRPFVPRFELHQPYLVRLESVSSAIETMSKDVGNDFGEFVRIQTASPECELMNLPSFLLKPVQRLMKYPLFFKQLWELTPRNHPDHLPTFSLLHSTDMIIRVMEEVKAQEEEYELAKNLATRIKGLPAGFQLAQRERRLVAQGLLRRIVLTEKERIALDSSTDAREHRGASKSASRMASASSDASSFAGDWAYHPTRAGNLAPSDTDRSLRAESMSSDVTLDSQPTDSRSTSRSRSSSLRGSLRHKSKESPVYAFVFTDLMVLTTPVSEKLHLLRSPKGATEGKETWKLINDVGVSRVLGVTDQSGQLANHDHLIAVELMSMTPNLLDTGVFSDGAAAIPVYLSIPDQKLSGTDAAPEAVSDAKAQWLDAFERCFRFTLRSLSFPSYSSNQGASGAGPDLDLDTKSSVMSILASGLPLPMSPSQQLGEAQRGRPADLVQEEREERGWWSLRFQQVLKEVQRSSRSPVLDAAPSRTRSQRQGGKRSETRPLILSPKPSSTPSRKGGLLSLGRNKSK